MPPIPLVDLHKDTYCLKEEIPVAGRLLHFLPFWEEVIQADHEVSLALCNSVLECTVYWRLSVTDTPSS